MHKLNAQFNGKLEMAIAIFTDTYPKKFLHQLISGQLDVDRMDYLTRDSFYSGVSEGTVAYDRILKMITVHDGALMVEEKAIFSIEKFLIARRLMYWQVYLHKTVLVAEQMLRKIITRAREIRASSNSSNLNKILAISHPKADVDSWLNDFCTLDDYDVLATIKHWMYHEDIVLATLSRGIIDRKLFKISYHNKESIAEKLAATQEQIQAQLHIEKAILPYFVFSGSVKTSLYTTADEKINILFKDGTVKDISQVDNALVHKNLATAEEKYYICCIANEK
jgi:uncharacterized protein